MTQNMFLTCYFENFFSASQSFLYEEAIFNKGCIEKRCRARFDKQKSSDNTSCIYNTIYVNEEKLFQTSDERKNRIVCKKSRINYPRDAARHTLISEYKIGTF